MNRQELITQTPLGVLYPISRIKLQTLLCFILVYKTNTKYLIGAN